MIHSAFATEAGIFFRHPDIRQSLFMHTAKSVVADLFVDAIN